MITFNCRSIRNKIVNILTYLDMHDIDICMMQETWLNKGDSAVAQEIKDQGYKIHSQRRLRGDIGGGVAIIYKPSILVRRCSPQSKFKSFEYISCTVHTNDKTIRIVNIYRMGYSKKHPHTYKVFLDEFTVLMESLATLPGELIITGDFNFHVENIGEYNDAREFLDLIDSFNLQNNVSGATHIRGGTLDLIVTASQHLTKDVTIVDDGMGSDHYPLLFYVDCSITEDNGYMTDDGHKKKI